MNLTFGDVAKLEQDLALAGQRVDGETVELWTDWYETAVRDGYDVGNRETVAELCEVIRASSEPRERELAAGALSIAKSSTKRPAKARFVLEFALKRLYWLRGASPRWGAVQLTDRVRREARAIFEAAKLDKSLSEEVLASEVSAFVARHGTDPDIFGTLARNLVSLLAVMGDPTAKADDREIARAALTYFAKDDDAIPDDLGLVGFLDDAVIAADAIAALRPERAQLISVLDGAVERWPFVKDLVFTDAGSGHHASEYLIVNAALLLESVTAAAERVVLVVPDPGPLAFLIGVVRGLAEARDCSMDRELPVYSAGERLSNLESGSEVEFKAYGRFVGTSFTSCPRGDATHFQFLERGGNKRARPLSDIASFRPAAKSTRARLKGHSAVFDRQHVDLGPLEHLFGSAQPLIIGRGHRRVVVTGKVHELRDVASRVRVLGAELRDIVPMGEARVTEQGFVERPWTGKAVGGDQLITVVRSGADTRAIVDDPNGRVGAVVAAIRVATTDAHNIAQLSTRNIPVIAMVRELDADSLSEFEEAGFKFWVWDETWFGALHWTRSEASTSHIVAAYERRVRSSAGARVSVELCDLPGLTDAYRGARALEKSGIDRSDDATSIAAGEAIGCVLELTKILAPPSNVQRHALGQRIAAFERTAAANHSYWSTEVIVTAQATVAGLRTALAACSADNAKFRALAEYQATKPNAYIQSPGRLWEQLTTHVETRRLKRAGPGPLDDGAELLVPCWLGRDRMLALMYPPRCARTTLLLYPPELEWYEASRRRVTALREKTASLADARTPFRKVKRTPLPFKAMEAKREPTSDPEDIALSATIAQVRRGLSANHEETIAAHVVSFAGGAWAAFTKGHRSYRVEGEGDDSTLTDVLVGDLRPGDLLVLLKGSDRDLLRAEVDARVAEGTRELAAEWQAALRRYIERGHTIEELRHALARVGCERASMTVRGWLQDQRIIQPLRGGEDIDMILAATGDRTLREVVDRCKDAAALLRGLHYSVAAEMATAALDRARAFLDAGTTPTELVQLDGRLVLVTVEAVGRNAMELPVPMVNRLQEDSWLG